jgi:uncharacterized phosphatase
MTQICLIRHGETDWNASGMIQGRTDIPLNANGVRQAEESAACLSGEQFDILITSPLKRARQTADIINRGLGLPITEMEAFAERYFGVAEGMTKEERETAYPDRNYPGLESRDTLKKRVMAGLKDIMKHHPNQHVLLIAHGAVINTILAALSGGEIGSGKTKLINACISRIAFEKGQWKINTYNQIDHLTSYQKR